MKRYPAYKDCGVEWIGAVPGHWQVAPLKHHFRILGGSTPKSDIAAYWDGDITWVSPADLSQQSSMYIDSSARTITAAGLESCGTTVVPPGSIVLSTRAPIGSLAIARKALCTNQGCKSLVPDASADSVFFAYALSAATEALNLRGKGTTFLELSADELGAFKMPVPEPQEQREVVSFLDRETAKIDALIAEQEKLIALLAEKRQATISHAVTRGLDPDVPMKESGVAWSGKVPKHWRRSRLKHIKAPVPNAFVDGPFGSNLKSEHFVEDGEVFVIESNFATQGALREEELKRISFQHFETVARSEVLEGDIVIAKIGAQFGKASILPRVSRRAVVSGNSLKLTVDRSTSDADWIHLQLVNLKACGEIDLLANGSAQPALSLGNMNCLPVLLPPIEEQRRILDFVLSVMNRCNALEGDAAKSIDLLRERRSALITAAVTGQIDVRGTAQPDHASPESTAA